MISIVIPVHNEEKRVSKILQNYSTFFEEKKKNKEIDDFELLFVINNTTDKTEEIIKQFAKKYLEIRYIRFKQGGKGFAVIEGFKEALKGDSELIGFVDGDMSTPPEAYYDLIQKINGYDGIIANRWAKESIISPRQPLFRRVVSRGGNFIIRTLFLLHYQDTQCGAKVFKREILEKNVERITTCNWGFDIALLFCLKNESHAKIKSISTIWHDQEGSKVDIKKTPIKTLLSTIRLRLVHSPFYFIVRFYRKLPNALKFKNV